MHALALPYRPGAPTFKYVSWQPWWLSAEDALQALQPGTPDGSATRSDGGE